MSQSLFGDSRSTFHSLVIAALCVAAVMALIVTGSALAQQSSRVTAVDPTSAKVADQVTASGDKLGKPPVSGIFLSDDKDDFKATVISQADDKIVFKVPQVKAGRYNISIQVGGSLLIEPVKLTIE